MEKIGRGETKMISSIVWIVLIEIGKINPNNAPRKVYIPIVVIEMVVYFYNLLRCGDK